MNRNPFLSIIIICYNYEQYLPRALLSIKDQSYTDYEIIYVDDASTDSSLAIARAFKLSNPQITMDIITMEANDVNRANLLAFYAVKGRYILKNDADDWLEPEAIKRFAEAAEKTDADMIVGLYQEIGEDGKIIRKRKISKSPNKWTVCEQQAGIYKTNLLNQNIIEVPPDFAMAGDAFFVTKFCINCKSAYFINNMVHNYFFHEKSSWNGKNQHKIGGEYFPKLCLLKIIDMYNELVSEANNNTDKNYITYAVSKKYYETIVKIFCDLSWKMAIKNIKLIQKEMRIKFPNYINNPLISIKENGYCFIPRVAVWTISKVEKFHLWFFLYLVVSVKKPKKYIKS